MQNQAKTSTSQYIEGMTNTGIKNIQTICNVLDQCGFISFAWRSLYNRKKI